MNHNNVYTIVNDFERVENSLNLGIPLCESGEDFSIIHDLRTLASVVGQIDFVSKKKHFFSFLGL